MVAILFLLLSLLHSSSITVATSRYYTPKGFPFKKFTEERDTEFFRFLGDDASIDGGALQLTPDSVNTDLIEHENLTGRIMLKEPIKLYLPANNHNKSDDVLASFNTSFVINLFRNRSWEVGEGFAFLIAPNLTIPKFSFGQWLGLTNAAADGSSDNRIVAVEFDTHKQETLGDPDGNHVGLNINSVRSNMTASLDRHNITLSPDEGTNHVVWIDYNGPNRTLQVFVAKQGEVKPKKPVLESIINLKNYINPESFFGFSASTGDPNIQLNCVLQWDLHVETLPKERDWKWVKIGVPIGVVAVVILALCGVFAGVSYHKKKRRRDAEVGSLEKYLKSLPGVPREFRYRELKKATKDFDESMKLGEGGFGVVFKGVLKDQNWNGNEVAVKKFSRDNIKGIEDFLAEITIIHRLHHKHLVRLVGWCYEKKKLLLVYDFMPNGSLDKHLYSASEKGTLGWGNRCKILAGVASALHYLHNEYDLKVVHRDLKSSNILLDLDFNARLGDFGLARAIENERNSYAEQGLGVPGTMGYVAPECFHTGKATPESDVYGFGAVVLEVVCGRIPGSKICEDEQQYTLVDWVWMLHRLGRIQEGVDKRLGNDYVAEQAEKLLLLGLACSHPSAGNRPQTRNILQIISGALPAPQVPPFKPVFTWPSMAMDTSTASSTLSNITLYSRDSDKTHNAEQPLNSSEYDPVHVFEYPHS